MSLLRRMVETAVAIAAVPLFAPQRRRRPVLPPEAVPQPTEAEPKDVAGADTHRRKGRRKKT
jgi:hypothetical protein